MQHAITECYQRHSASYPVHTLSLEIAFCDNNPNSWHIAKPHF